MTASLSHKEQEILILSLDNELNWINRIRFNLIIQKQAAKDFIAEHQELRKNLNFNNDIGKVDFWDKISSRIVAEERAELYLGKRQNKSFETLQINPWYSAAAGLAAAAAIVLVLNFNNKQDNTQKYAASSNTSSNVSTPVRTNFASTNSRNMEVDWMRSDGRLQVYAVPGKSHGVIWIKKNNRQASVNQVR